MAALLSYAVAVVCVLAFAGLARASLPGLVVAVVGAFLLGWLLYPTSCDTHESFLDLPNKTCSCLGTTPVYYPQGIYDGTEVDYCIGLESPTSRSHSPPSPLSAPGPRSKSRSGPRVQELAKSYPRTPMEMRQGRRRPGGSASNSRGWPSP